MASHKELSAPRVSTHTNISESLIINYQRFNNIPCMLAG